MLRTTCPSCGAPVVFRSHASVMAVCEYCQSTLLREADAVRDIGKMSAVLDDPTPVRLGMAGRWKTGGQGRAFTVVGRIQLRYDAGFWNEWRIVFEDGQDDGWLSDGSGQFVITTPAAISGPLPAFEQLRPGQALTAAGTLFTASDVRTAQATGCQGELPMAAREGWTARVADFRSGKRFLTLDYSVRADRPEVYLGESVDFAALDVQLAKSADEQLEAAAGGVGRLSALACPSCGNSIRYVAGQTPRLVCPGCGSTLEVADERAAVLQAADRRDETALTFELGATATIAGTAFTLIGAMQREVVGEGDRWTEYLLYAPAAGFMWLSETSEGWQQGKVLDHWPEGSGDSVRLDGSSFDREYDYDARVVYAIGAFNWKVQVGDQVHVVEYARGDVSLAAETDAAEQTWSRNQRIDARTVYGWFGKAASAPAVVNTGGLPVGIKAIRNTALIMLVVIVIIPALAGGLDALMWALAGVAGIWLPASVLAKFEE